MKKLLTLSNILKASAALLGIIAFVMMFTKQLWIGNSSNKAFVDFKDALFDKDFGSAISFVGYLFLLFLSVPFISMSVQCAYNMCKVSDFLLSYGI